MRYFLLLASIAIIQAATVDRLAITVGPTVVTELQIDEDLRVAALLNGQPIQRDLDSRRAAADRLVEQLLIQHEIDLSHYPAPSDEEITIFYNQIAKTLGGVEHLKQLLAEYDLTEQTLRAHLSAQLATLRFIEFRFRPDVNVTDSEIEEEYRRQFANSTTTLPAMDAKEKAKVTEMLVGERTDAALNSWLAENRKQVNIVYLDKDLR